MVRIGGRKEGEMIVRVCVCLGIALELLRCVNVRSGVCLKKESKAESRRVSGFNYNNSGRDGKVPGSKNVNREGRHG